MEKNLAYFRHYIKSLNLKEYIHLKSMIRNEPEIKNILSQLKEKNVIIPIGKKGIQINNTSELINLINAMYFEGLNYQ